MLKPEDLDAPVQRELIEPDKRDRRPALRPHLAWAWFQGHCQKAHPRRRKQSEHCQIACCVLGCNSFGQAPRFQGHRSMVPLLTDVESVRRIAKTRARPAFWASDRTFADAGGMLGC